MLFLYPWSSDIADAASQTARSNAGGPNDTQVEDDKRLHLLRLDVTGICTLCVQDGPASKTVDIRSSWRKY